MKILLNGEERDVAKASSVADLLTAFEWKADRVAVEVNRELVRRREHAERRLSEGDVVEIVTLVGGG